MNDCVRPLGRFTFCAVFAATLVACGGGSGGSTAAAVALATDSSPASGASEVGPSDSPTMSALGVALTGEGSGSLWTEGAKFRLTGPQVVQYGVDDRWVSKSVSGDVVCSNEFFGSDPAFGVVKSCKPATATTSALGSEGAAFTVSGTRVVQYGAGSTWITKSVTGSGSCSNAFFGSDPVPNVVKSCQLVVASVTLLAAEGAALTVTGTQTVQYGAADRWLTRSVTGKATCSTAFFGTDPIAGTAKVCQLVTTVTAPATLASEGKAFSVSGTQMVQYGAGAQWATKSVTGTGTCSNAFFGRDPVQNVAKTCQLSAATPTFAGIVPGEMTAVAAEGGGATTGPVVLASTSSLAPYIDPAKLAQPAVGYSTERIAAANVADPGQNPAPSDIGNFREPCDFSHMSYDDPIVNPGSVGSHLHTFFGNTGTNSKSTAQSLASTGNSTCAGGISNRTAYWVPTVIDTKDGTPLKPIGSLMYYKQGYNYVPAASIKPFPAGLRMVAGNSASTGIQDGITGFTCFKPDGTWTTNSSIPRECPAGSTLTITVSFPQCWDGVNVDSPDHKSHMAYPGIGCPSTHPVALTHITLNINYSVTEANATGRWRLSSDNYDRSQPGGYSSHADWFNGWNTAVMNVWTTRCINASMDCHAYLIGDGRILF